MPARPAIYDPDLAAWDPWSSEFLAHVGGAHLVLTRVAFSWSVTQNAASAPAGRRLLGTQKWQGFSPRGHQVRGRRVSRAGTDATLRDRISWLLPVCM